MTNDAWRASCLAAVLLLSLPGLAPAQTAAGPFAALSLRVKPGQTVIVTDETGRKIKGEVEAVSGSSLDIVLTKGQTGARVAVKPSVREIRRVGTTWDGALKGALVAGGMGALIGGIKYDGYGTGQGAWLGARVGLVWGTIIGWGVDAAFGPAVIYRRTGAALAVTPIVDHQSAGARASLTF